MENKLFSVILLSYFSEKRIAKCYSRLSEIFAREGIPFELVIMDDGSSDQSYAVGLELEAKYDNVRAFQLSKNYSSHYSIFAGLSVCKGGCAMPIPDDEQKPYELLVDMYRLWEKGEKIVIPYRISRNDPAISKFLSRSFYRVMNSITEVNFPEGGADVCLIDREVIDILNTRIHPINTSTIAEILRLGFSPHYVPYLRPTGTNNKSRWSFKKKMRLAKDTFFSSSSFPIKLITNLGFLFSFVSLLMIICFTVIRVFNIKTSFFIFNANVQGWTSLIVAISFFSGLILLSLGIISEYIYRIYEEVKGRPGYLIKNKPSN